MAELSCRPDDVWRMTDENGPAYLPGCLDRTNHFSNSVR
jgi:hypothetical protein